MNMSFLRVRRVVVALGVVGATLPWASALAPAAHASGCTWDLAHDFPTSSDPTVAPAMPGADTCGNSGVWGVGYGFSAYTTDTSGSLTAGSLSSFSPAADAVGADWSPNVAGVAGVQGWQHPASYPYVGKNTNSTPSGPTCNGAGVWPAGAVIAHPNWVGSTDTSGNPYPNRAVVEWISPITGTVDISATITSLDICGSSGIDGSIDLKTASGSAPTNVHWASIANGGHDTYSATAVSVNVGDTYYFSVGDNDTGNFGYESTQFAVTITSGTPTVTGTAPAAPTGVSASVAGLHRSAAVSWTDDPATTSAIIDHKVLVYQVNRKGNSSLANTIDTLSTAASYTVTGLSTHTSYFFEVQTENGTGWSASSAPSATVKPVR